MSITLELGSMDPNSYKLPSIGVSSSTIKLYEPGHNKNLRKSQLYVPIVNYDAISKSRSRSSMDMLELSNYIGTETTGSRVLEKIGVRYSEIYNS